MLFLRRSVSEHLRTQVLAMTIGIFGQYGRDLTRRPGFALKLGAFSIVAILVALPLIKILAFTVSADAVNAWYEVTVSRLSYNLFWGPLRTTK